MSRADMEQFVRKFDKPDAGDSGKGREVKGEVRKDENLAPRKDVGERIKAPLITSRAERGTGAIAQDTNASQTQGLRTPAPTEIRSRWEAYQKSISRSRPSSRSAPSGGQK